MPRVPGENDGLGKVAAAVGITGLVLGFFLPVLLLVGGAVGLGLSVRARRRVVDGDAGNPRTVLVAFMTSCAALGLYLVLLTFGVLRASGVLA